MELLPYLKNMVEKRASDLYFSTGAPVSMKVEGVTSHITQHVMNPGATKKLAYSVMNDHQRAEFEKELELDLAITVEQLGRFRLNVFLQRNEVALVIRYITSEIPTIESLNLPLLLNDLVMEPRGLVLVVGTTGSGKSTTLASMIEYRNQHKTGHILTIEDPIEYLHHHHRSMVNQREVGVDTHSFNSALRRAMRESPDVIMLGEIRDRETMQQAITYAETGHLCLSTLHASNADKALRRIVNFFPEAAHAELFMDLSLHLRAIISQRLLVGTDNKRIPAVEVLLASPYVKDLIGKGDIDNIHEAMEKSTDQGMQSFDQSLLDLIHQGKITNEVALDNADSRNNLAIKIRLEGGRGLSPGSGMRLSDR
ncbi:type IV pili twitching motility protein PilT [Hahella sp. CCB-MM4]|uniref:PilT/PilU family type 4a pilus ATPase n=1 Tax=Hahella sp. (strain CCB-MM4) TaxID=1926491 RepID=UPI000B9A8F92|nr:PilT/PilU family type 4a pilus ATPase [Hahella sp. CCB-MM4]OZG72963.1 type IV pili twitching motility protein PilT [Hahella sp. CCB-MM4]